MDWGELFRVAVGWVLWLAATGEGLRARKAWTSNDRDLAWWHLAWCALLIALAVALMVALPVNIHIHFDPEDPHGLPF